MHENLKNISSAISYLTITNENQNQKEKSNGHFNLRNAIRWAFYDLGHIRYKTDIANGFTSVRDIVENLEDSIAFNTALLWSVPNSNNTLIRMSDAVTLFIHLKKHIPLDVLRDNQTMSAILAHVKKLILAAHKQKRETLNTPMERLINDLMLIHLSYEEDLFIEAETKFLHDLREATDTHEAFLTRHNYYKRMQTFKYAILPNDYQIMADKNIKLAQEIYKIEDSLS